MDNCITIKKRERAEKCLEYVFEARDKVAAHTFETGYMCGLTKHKENIIIRIFSCKGVTIKLVDGVY
jgi:hypothetical protein